MDARHWSETYDLPASAYDEMRNAASFRQPYELLQHYLQRFSAASFREKEALANDLFLSQGITFTVYKDDKGIERIFPFDILPRIITAIEWKHIEAGIKQRLTALNHFLNDVYHEQQIIKDGK